jgi:hypothetical protein
MSRRGRTRGGFRAAAEPMNREESTMETDACLVFLEKIWARAPHNAMTDLVRFRDGWVCVFREGTDHVSPDGRIRVLSSRDGSDWSSTAELSMPGADLRDPKITETPSGKLMLNAAAAYPESAPLRHQSYAWFSADGREWSTPQKIGDGNYWIWRVKWLEGIAYAFAYSTVDSPSVRLYSSPNGRDYALLADRLFVQDSPNEASLTFENDGTGLCLLRRDAGAATAQLGLSLFPYTKWAWKDLGVRIGGPHLLALPDGRVVAAVRRYGDCPWTSLNWVDAKEGKLTEFLALPSGGDTSYAGLCRFEDRLWVSYYSSHEGKASIYLAKVRLPSPA